MDSYLTNLLFAANLLDYLFKELNFPWESPYVGILGKKCPKPRFDEGIGQAVNTIWQRNAEDIKACYIELWNAGVHDKGAFGKYALSAAESYFPEGYSPGSFLGYCAIVLGVATSYYEYPPNGVPEKAAEVVALVLFSHQLTREFYTSGGWNGLAETSWLFNRATKQIQ